MSWVGVLVMTAINVFIFLKLKTATEQMLKTAFPGAKNMTDAMAQAQKMMGVFGGGMGGARGGKSEDQLKNAMKMLQQMQKNNQRR